MTKILTALSDSLSRWQGCLRASPIRDRHGYTMSGPIERDQDERGIAVTKTAVLWRHVKTGNTYRIVGYATHEKDMTPLTLYARAGIEMPRVWARPTKEFIDGRFVAEHPEES